jgi:hypothetical protein
MAIARALRALVLCSYLKGVFEPGAATSPALRGNADACANDRFELLALVLNSLRVSTLGVLQRR